MGNDRNQCNVGGTVALALVMAAAISVGMLCGCSSGETSTGQDGTSASYAYAGHDDTFFLLSIDDNDDSHGYPVQRIWVDRDTRVEYVEQTSAYVSHGTRESTGAMTPRVNADGSYVTYDGDMPDVDD